MKPAYDFNGVTLYQGDSAEVLKALPDASVHCIITSPPYFQLRDYKTGTWEGGAEECDHIKQYRDPTKPAHSGGVTNNRPDLETQQTAGKAGQKQYSTVCGKCGATRIDKQIGLEASPAAHLEALLRVFRECYRVLRPDGVMAVNYGDSYGGGQMGPTQTNRVGGGSAMLTQLRDTVSNVKRANFLPAKNLLGMPWRLAFALQAEGWILRSALPFFKVTAMPESCRDRPTAAHEYVFLFVKQARYWYDGDAVRRPAQDRPFDPARKVERDPSGLIMGKAHNYAPGASGFGHNPAGRNFRTSDVYPLALADQLEAVDAELERLTLLRCHLEKLTTARGLLTDPDGEPLALNLVSEPTKESHFAAFGTNLVKPLLLSGCPETVCAKCGAGYVREVESKPATATKLCPKTLAAHEARGGGGKSGTVGKSGGGRKEGFRRTLGFSPSCTCNAPTAPGVVLDPFSGTGTVALVARALGRKAVGIELSSEYLDIARRRLGQGSLFLTDGEETPDS